MSSWQPVMIALSGGAVAMLAGMMHQRRAARKTVEPGTSIHRAVSDGFAVAGLVCAAFLAYAVVAEVMNGGA